MKAELLAKDFLRLTAAAMMASSLYPETHPIRDESMQDLWVATTSLIEAQRDASFFVHQDSFFVNDHLLAKESLTLQWMMRSWQHSGTRSISITDKATKNDLAALIEYLVQHGPAPQGNISINTAELLEPEQEEARTLAGIRGAYSNALDILRETGLGDITLRPRSLEPARRAVDGLVEEVLSDTASALLLSTMRSHDEYTFFHMVNVCILSIATGSAIGLSHEHISTLGLGAILHDMGKVAVPQETLNRSGELSEWEWEQIRRHPVEGATVILSSWERLSPLAAQVSYEHHLHVDGTGYPGTAPGHRPGLLSRIVSVADTYDAITSRRSYRRAEQRQRALDILLSGAGNHYDPRIVRVFIRMLGFYPPGSVVSLNDGTIGVVVRNTPGALSQPVIRLVRDNSGKPTDGEELDLSDQPHLSVVEGLDQDRAGVDPNDLIA
ncbi:MAG: HD-GYP domain-containing protein [Actinomycetota bacterium]|nr:HD-GYP domain-containing protein [Actinomycetota bacterium]